MKFVEKHEAEGVVVFEGDKGEVIHVGSCGVLIINNDFYVRDKDGIWWLASHLLKSTSSQQTELAAMYNEYLSNLILGEHEA